MRKLLALTALTVLVGLGAAAAGCGSACQDVAERICGCQPAGSTRDSCVSSVKNQIGSGVQRPSSSDQAYCEQLLLTCNDPSKDSTACDALNSPQGKVNCGLAYP